MFINKKIPLILLTVIVSFFTLRAPCWGEDDVSPEFKKLVKEVIICSYQQGYEDYINGNTCKQALALTFDMTYEKEDFSKETIGQFDEVKKQLIELSEICFRLGAMDRIKGKNHLQEYLNNHKKVPKFKKNKSF